MPKRRLFESVMGVAQRLSTVIVCRSVIENACQVYRLL